MSVLEITIRMKIASCPHDAAENESKLVQTRTIIGFENAGTNLSHLFMIVVAYCIFKEFWENIEKGTEGNEVRLCRQGGKAILHLNPTPICAPKEEQKPKAHSTNLWNQRTTTRFDTLISILCKSKTVLLIFTDRDQLTNLEPVSLLPPGHLAFHLGFESRRWIHGHGADLHVLVAFVDDPGTSFSDEVFFFQAVENIVTDEVEALEGGELPCSRFVSFFEVRTSPSRHPTERDLRKSATHVDIHGTTPNSVSWVAMPMSTPNQANVSHADFSLRQSSHIQQLVSKQI
ncbi:hypothetical protein LXL04_015871 [Taraxacum kok-saghyz]